MTVKNAKLVSVIAAITLGIGGFGCGPKTAADTERDWNATTQNAQKYASKYPAAKAVIDDLTKQATADFEAAKTADEKSRADKMQVAVDRLGKPLAIFGTYEGEVAKLDTLLHDKDLLASVSAADFKPLDTAASAAKKRACCILQPTDKACSDLPGTCVPGPALANMGDVQAQLESALADLRAAERGLEAKKPRPVAPVKPAPAGSAAAAPAGSAAPAPAAGSAAR